MTDLNMNLILNPYQALINNLKERIIQSGTKLEDVTYRISMQADLERVKLFGSSRVGLSDKLWDKLDEYNFKNNAGFAHELIRHDEVVIASLWEDLESDVLLENGTLKHKLNIYEKPFFTLYHRHSLLELGHENSHGENNQGRHYFFLDEPKKALHSLWQIHQKNDTDNTDINTKTTPYFVEKILWN